MTVTISRLYDDATVAQAAIGRLQQAGVVDDDISLLANNSEKWFSPDLATAAGKGAAVGAGFGGVGGLLAGLGLLVVPGLGPVVAAGWLAAALTCAAAAGAAGGILGMLAEAGVATNEAEIYAESIRRGGSLVSARVPDEDKARLEALLDPSSVDIAQRRSELQSSGWAAFEPAAAAPATDDRAGTRSEPAG
ncbi:hypothetical protein HNR60_001057 [Rhodopseudomonas rhenobacensis]|uniref:DUF1269 domain-containing protein n=1 Tax=Rhodopseudomonas rhenobacensis TaxID=87461 RepID=A0A7W7Z1N8_9BRAD|nr:hypothetical protein [Rhodopseudomonas rhenobacensis]MBB5046312.1 hypothetical protein [Rhodopseudomonas rhenobacensis]